ncbi:MAG: TonB-dependent receptor [candidate division KSB1 bacterium]|nr:TonB-dependent receptor [candidate division KSB1 bacterium]MDZ7273516.1 TonB-dependent receptor [candidate division KSB1 bacterium]MDZ7286893.1 TonB-dependent receptor [candidate division KSB1 bacterium]MDZ7299754.1 TonB-dependent receptor [candidate division KSB1 bacterium]MDZ7305693.1 TonB-dependent receptor [candidate division KSB1 bacterium]
MPSFNRLIVFCVLLAALAGFAGTTGKIAGKVTDRKSGEPLPGVTIVVAGTRLGTVTDHEGKFIILQVPPGIHTVRASLIGYQEMVYESVRVSIDLTTPLDFQLGETVLELGQTVTVVAQRPLIQKDLTSTSNTVGAETIAQLPVDNLSEVVNLQAGVVEGHFRGGRSGEVAYLINGIAVNDVYSGSFALQVENNAIQELEVISGTFNAEYGQAMSGVVNVVTKEGGEQFHGSLSSFLGDYVSTHDDIFWNIGAFNPIYNFEASFSGPLPRLGNKLTFFAAARAYHNEGALYGRRVFWPSDSSNFPGNAVRDWYIEARGRGYRFLSDADFQRLADSLKASADFVAMNPNRRLTGQLKLVYQPAASVKIDYEGLLQQRDFREYDHSFRFNPDGNSRRKQRAWSSALAVTRVFNSRTFLQIKGAAFNTDYRQFVHENPLDPAHVNPELLNAASGNAFRTGGEQMWHFYRNTRTHIGKLDFTWQATSRHLLKMGLETRRHRLWLRAFEIRLNRDTGFKPHVPQQTNNVSNNDMYLRRPYEISAYVQDKMEFDDLIVNAGLRFDYFNANGRVPDDFGAPNLAGLLQTGGTGQLSPRLGLAYPITDRGVIHISYGHFFQIPNFAYLYSTPEFEIYPTQYYGSTPPPERTPNVIGNAALKPQHTAIYEIGLQQQLGEAFALDLTAYAKDIRNLLGTEILYTVTGIRYARYINRDYGSVRGFTVSFEKRRFNGLAATVDYTFQIARGNASDPNSAYLDVQANREPNKELVPLEWDRTHSLNVTLTAGDPARHSLGVIGKFGSGLPYTPTAQNVRTGVENSERRPNFINFDLYVSKNVRRAGLQSTVFVRVYNLFDRKNELQVFSDTGRANYSLSALTGGTILGLNTAQEYFTRPDFYSEPRQVIAGVTVEF